MKYLLLVYGDSSSWGTLPPEEAKAELERFAEFERSAGEAGVLVTQGALQPESDTITVLDGPAESAAAKPERWPGCFYVLESRDLVEVKEWASRVPLVGPGGFHTIEIRPVMGPSVRERDVREAARA
jgi:hypothetical protein